MAQPIIKEVLFGDGEGLDFNDLNNVQRYASAKLHEALLAPHMRRREWSESFGAIPTLNGIHVIGAGAIPRNGASNRQIINRAGSIFYDPGSGFSGGGDAPAKLVHYLEDSEISVTLDAGGAQDRWDVISLLVEEETTNVADQVSRDFKDAVTGLLSSTTPVKKRRTKLTVTVTKGAEAATPVEPAIPAGNRKWCAVKVPAGHAGAFSPPEDFLRDYCMPARHATQVLTGRDMHNASFSGVAGLLTVVAGAASEKVFIHPGRAGGRRNAVLKRIILKSTLDAAALVKLVRLTWTPGNMTTGSTVLRDLSATFAGQGAGAHVEWEADQPYWLHGHQCREKSSGDTNLDSLAIEIISGAAADAVGTVVLDTGVD